MHNWLHLFSSVVWGLHGVLPELPWLHCRHTQYTGPRPTVTDTHSYHKLEISVIMKIIRLSSHISYHAEHTAPHIHMTESLHLHTSLHACLVNHQSALFFNGQYKYNTYLSLQHLCIIIYTSVYIMYVKKPGKYFKFSSLSLIIIDRSIITETPCHGTMRTLSPEAPSWKHC